MSGQQASLCFSRATIAQDDAVKLMALLRTLGGWRLRVSLQCYPECWQWHERRFRAAARASNGHILGGDKGYCWHEHATVDEARHARNRLAGQIEDMKQRLLEIDRVFHGRV